MLCARVYDSQLTVAGRSAVYLVTITDHGRTSYRERVTNVKPAAGYRNCDGIVSMYVAYMIQPEFVRRTWWRNPMFAKSISSMFLVSATQILGPGKSCLGTARQSIYITETKPATRNACTTIIPTALWCICPTSPKWLPSLNTPVNFDNENRSMHSASQCNCDVQGGR